MDNNTQTQMDVDMSEFTVSVSVSRQRVEDLFTLGWRGSYYWCRFMASTDLPAGCVSYPQVLFAGGQLIFREKDEGSDHAYEPLTLDRAAVARGLQLMQEKTLTHFANFLHGREDETTGDVFMQLALFGELRYG